MNRFATDVKLIRKSRKEKKMNVLEIKGNVNTALRQLIIPLDTHVHQISLELGLTQQRTATLKTALEITEALSHIFPDDPCLGDFALFGYDINKGK